MEKATDDLAIACAIRASIEVKVEVTKTCGRTFYTVDHSHGATLF